MLLCALFVFPCATIGYASNGGAETELVSATKKEKKKKTSENSECLRPLEEFFSFLGNNTIQ